MRSCHRFGVSFNPWLNCTKKPVFITGFLFIIITCNLCFVLAFCTNIAFTGTGTFCLILLNWRSFMLTGFFG